ncbi:bifunctional 5,10-methylenetetrahydrofolate dehydrogenase/5,10-methenyltetrahydrofolate cyclohydrolase [Acaryochloris marina]|uniref:bifunctional 5,10-methylenetetrahydrofolate dehydrogenase/5,10-methenyltetrahydrofolate cyclohydrolase n=1 Tax=Acaryochloris marina TaxID=155978 RepID=UPI00164F3BA3|nr:bifunctional 5,10-methylenetetrahydrofolate dehydrogenase/5,10-methenyltetrahydrofolate cyclohydrolase [Acaryochloris marina]
MAKYEAARFSTEHKVKTFKALGCEVEHLNLDASTTSVEFGRLLKHVNKKSISVIVQNPFPEDFKSWLSEISYEKDIDGLRRDNPFFRVSATSETIFRIVEPFAQENDVVAVVGAEGFVGGGVTRLLEESGISVIGLDKNDDLTLTRQANIVVSAMGSPNELDERHIIPEHRLVVDSGFIPLADSPILGDVNRSAYDIPLNITPVPGGVGPFQMATLMERLVRQVTGKQIQQWDIPNSSTLPIYASAVGRGRVLQDNAKAYVIAYEQGKPFPDLATRLMNKDFDDFKEGLHSLQTWYGVAEQLGKSAQALGEISDVEKDFRQGQSISKETREQMDRDINQLAYNRLSAEISEEESQEFLVRLATNAFKQGISSFQVKKILSFSPMIRDLEARKGERASQHYTGEIMREGWKMKKREQPPPPGQDRGPDIDRGPSRGR